MKRFFAALSQIFRKKPKTDWDNLPYGKPSDAQDEFRDRNNV